MFGLRRRMDAPPALLRTEWRPLKMLEGLEEWFDRFMEGLPEEGRLGAFWKTTTEELDKEVVYRMELPGFEAKEVEVRLVDHMLVVEAKTAAAPEKKEEAPSRYYRREIELPARLDAAKVEAVYRNGMLEVHVPRLPEVEGRRIEVKT